MYLIVNFIEENSGLNENDSESLVILILLCIHKSIPLDLKNDKSIIDSIMKIYDSKPLEVKTATRMRRNFNLRGLKSDHISGYSNLKYIVMHTKENFDSIIRDVMLIGLDEDYKFLHK